MKFFEYTPDISQQWDAFVLQSSRGSVHQLSAWKGFQETIPGRGLVRGWGIKNDYDKIIAATFAVAMDTGFMRKKWWYSARGPVFESAEIGRALIQQVAGALKKEGGMFWRFDPYVAPDFWTHDFIKMQLATQNYQPTDTLVIDLLKSEEQLLSEMKRKGRYNISLAEKKGIRCVAISGKSCTPKDVGDFWNLNKETTRRDDFSGHEISYYQNFLEYLSEYATLFFAETEEGKRIASAIATFVGDKAIYYFGASTSDPEYRNFMAPYLLQWTMIQEAKKRGCKTYDFLGIAPENEPHHPYAGISEFKWKFGGDRHVFAAGREIVFHPFWYALYRIAKKLK